MLVRRRHRARAAAELNVKPVPAVDPYKEQIEAVNRQIGTIPPREVMKDASGASMMDPETQITRLHGVSILDLATRAYEENLVLALVREYPDDTGRALANVALNAYVDLHGTPMLAAAHAAREAGSSPNTALCAAVALTGPNLVEGARTAVQALLEVFRTSGIADLTDPNVAVDARIAATTPEQAGTLLAAEPDPLAEAMLAGAQARGAVETAILRYLTGLAAAQGRHPSADAVLAAICFHLAWRPLLHKRISVTTLANLPWHLRVAATMVGASVNPNRQTADSFGGVPVHSLIDG